MDGPHDLGGSAGHGPVIVEEDEPVWHADWEKAVFAMFPCAFVAGWLTLDSARAGVEQMHPDDYLAVPYYGHWYHAIELHGIRAGAVDPAELDKRTRHYLEHPDAPLPEDRNPDLAGLPEVVGRGGASARRDRPARPAFVVGDRIRVRGGSAPGHTRRAGYTRGRTGTVVAARGAFVYPDSAAAGHGDDPQHVYTVRFESTALWGPDGAESRAAVHIDVFEPYIEPAAEPGGAL